MLLFFSVEKVLDRELEGINAQRAKTHLRLPVVMSKSEIKSVLEQIKPCVLGLALRVLYGCGLRLSEGICLRTKDVDVENQCVWVLDGKGGRYRCLTVSLVIVDGLKLQRQRAWIYS